MTTRRLLILGGAFTAFLAAGLLGAYDASLGVILQGAALGLGTGLMAVGLVLIYRTTRVINFAYGAMGTVAGAVATSMTVGRGVNWFVAVVVAVAIGVAVGLVVEVLIIRRFATSPRLVLTVATIGLAQALGGLALSIPRWFDAPALNPGFDTQLSRTKVVIEPVALNGNHLVMAAVGPIVLLALSWFLFRTDAGTAVRGMADNLDRARLVGIPVDRLDLLLWGIAGALAAITVVLRAPTQGLSVDAAAGPTLLLAPLAAAVIVGMRSLVGAFLVGVAIEIIDQLVQINMSSRTWTTVVLLVLIVGGLLLQEGPKGRGEGGGTWSTVGVAKALPARLAGLPEVRGVRIVIALLVTAAVVAIPLAGSPSQVRTATIAVIYGLAALSLIVLTGWGGVVSLGQWALVGVGGVITANLIADLDLDLFLTMVLSAIGAGVVAALIGLPALRVSGELLAVTTLAFAVAMQVHVINPATYPWLIPSDYERPLLWNRIDLSDEEALYGLCVAVLAATAFVVSGLRRTRTGRVIQATRDNPRAAAAAAIGSTRTKLTAFVLSGMIAGVAGTLHAVTLQGLGTNTYSAADSLLLFSMAVIGGISSIGGVLAAVALVQWLGYAFPDIQLLLTGVGLLVILLVIPGGVGQAFERARDRFARAVARRRGIDVVDDLDTVDLTHATPEQEATAAALDAERADRDAAQRVAEAGFTPAADATDALFACTGVETGYGSLQVLFGVDMSVREGEVLALLGTNGAGKSTFFRTGLNLLPTWAGQVTFDGHDVTTMAPERIARLGLSLMPGGKGLFTSLTVGENLRLATWMLRGDVERARARTEEMLDTFPVLRDRWDQQAGTLSGGEQQQLSLAMAFVTRPKLVFIDELSLGLAPTIVGLLVEKVKELHRQGTTVVVVEQSINVALLMCEEAMFLEKGQVRFRGPTSGLLEQPEILRAVFLGSGDEEEHVLPPPDERTTRGVALECRGVTKSFGGITAVDEVDLTVAPGRIVGLIGHNGAGKTTLFDVLTGFLPLDGGSVHLGGRDVSELPPHRRAILEVGRSFQEALLYPSLTVEETVLVALERHLANRDPVAAAFRLPASIESEFHARRRAEELLALLGLDGFRDHVTGELSTGTRRIVELACLLAQDPAVILLDEPTAGVAQAETEALAPLLRRIQAETGCSMVVIEHDMALLSALCDELVALEQGRVIATGTPTDVLADPAVVASYLGTDDAVVHRSGSRRPSTTTSD